MYYKEFNGDYVDGVDTTLAMGVYIITGNYIYS